MIERNFDAFITDLDGSLVSNEPHASAAYRILFRARGVEPVPEPNGLIHIVGTSGNMKRLIARHGLNLDLKEEMIQRWGMLYTELIYGHIEAVPGVMELLDLARTGGMKIGLASSSWPEHIRISIDSIGVRHFYQQDAIVSCKEVGESKPSPRVYIEVARRLGIPCERCAALEDTASGYLSAHGAGMKVIAVRTEHNAGHDFGKSRIVSSLSEITWEILQEPKAL